MSDFIESINKITKSHPTKLVLSKPTGKENQFQVRLGVLAARCASCSA